MSVLETPRILFKGELAWDPITTNNYDTYYDEAPAVPVFPTVHDRVKAFREEAIAAVTTAGNWNPAGTHRSTFYDSAISGVDLGTGVTRNDPFIASPANFSGMLVDLEPYGAYSSQLFFDQMQFGIDGGYRIRAPRSTRVTARYINFARNSANAMIAGVASVVWQTSFDKTQGLRIDAFDSPALQALQAAMADDDVLGLTVRWNTYRTIYYDDLALTNGSPLTKAAGQALIDKLNAGGFQPNPARSVMVGVIGLWRRDEPLHEPGDRALLQSDNSPVASAHVRIAPATLTLDLANSIPETSKDLTKQDLGTLSMVAIDPTTRLSITLGSFGYDRYDRTAYEATSGIVTLLLEPGHAGIAERCDLELRQADGTVLLAEEALRAIPERPNVYLNGTETETLAFRLYDRGRPLTRAVPVLMCVTTADGTIRAHSALISGPDGRVTIQVTGDPPGGISAYVPVPGPSPVVPQAINTQLNTYMYVRSLPQNDAIAELEPTWDNVYRLVLANWNAMAPCMDNWLMLDDPVQVKRYGPMLKRLTDPARFEDFRFMPVTRDMTVAERTLLYRFLDAPDDPAATTEAMAEAVAPARPDYVALSRAMRRP